MARVRKRLPLDRLRPAPGNPRRISGERLEALKRSLAADPEMLEARPLVALPDGVVVCGNMRLLAARELGWETIPVVTVELDPERARLWMLRDNQEYGEWEEQALAALLAEMSELELDLSGFSGAEVDRLLAGGRFTALDPDLVPPVPAAPRSKLGELYELGPHRLLCGDATDPDQVRALFADESAALLATDPPYGVGVDHTWRDGLRQPVGSARTGKVTNDDRSDWRQAYALTDAGVAYVWHSALHGDEVQQGLAAAGYRVRQQIVWVKTVHALGRAAYQWRHECCWYAVRKGASARWCGDRTQTTVWEAPSPIMAYAGGQDDQRTRHPTQKPVVLFERPIANHTRRGEIVYDPFAGSGTCLIAAERLGRRCYAIELDPAYCDVVRDRYQTYAGG